MTNNTYVQNRRHGLGSQRDAILPSIEGPQLPAPSGQIVNRSLLPSIKERRAVTTRKDADHRVDEIEFLDLTDDIIHPNKRPKMDHSRSGIPGMPLTVTAMRNQPSQQRKQEFNSLASPTTQFSDHRNSNTLVMSRYEGSQGHGKASPFIPIYRETQTVPSPVGVSRGSQTRVGRLPFEQPSGVGQFRLHEGLSPPTSSPKMNAQPIPSHRLQSTFPGGASPVDRGIQEYRAFRARERQDRALRSPSGRGRLQLREHSDRTHAAVEPERGQLGQIDGVGSLHDLSDHSPSQRPVQGLVAIPDSVRLSRRDAYTLPHERTSERIAHLRRRSASPAQNPRTRMSYVPAMPQAYLPHQPKEFAEYIPVEWDRRPQRGGLEAVVAGQAGP